MWENCPAFFTAISTAHFGDYRIQNTNPKSIIMFAFFFLKCLFYSTKTLFRTNPMPTTLWCVFVKERHMIEFPWNCNRHIHIWFEAQNRRNNSKPGVIRTRTIWLLGSRWYLSPKSSKYKFRKPSKIFTWRTLTATEQSLKLEYWIAYKRLLPYIFFNCWPCSFSNPLILLLSSTLQTKS